MTIYCGSGVVNNLLNKLPIEIHAIGGYQYCGPGTKLEKRLARGDCGINPLDAACKEHDIAYSQHPEDVAARNTADRILAQKAWQRVTAKDSKIGEKLTAMGVAGIMKVKSKMGMGLKKKNTSFRKIITAAKNSMKVDKDAKKVIKSALHGARNALRETGGKKNVNVQKLYPLLLKVVRYR